MSRTSFHDLKNNLVAVQEEHGGGVPAVKIAILLPKEKRGRRQKYEQTQEVILDQNKIMLLLHAIKDTNILDSDEVPF